jgi:hypothetical protein
MIFQTPIMKVRIMPREKKISFTLFSISYSPTHNAPANPLGHGVNL